MAKYTQRTDGRYSTRIKTGIKDDGTADYKYLTATSEEVLDKLVASHRRQAEGTHVDPNKTTMSQWMESWLNDVKKGTVRQNTWEFYRGIINHCIKPHIGTITMANLQASDLRKLYTTLQAKGLSNARIHHAHVALNNALTVAIDDGVLQTNVCQKKTVREKARPPETKSEKVVLSKAQALALIISLDGWWKMLVLLAWSTGMRLGELLGLRWADVDEKKRTISVVKTITHSAEKGVESGDPKNSSSFRTLTIDKSCMVELQKWRNQQKDSRRVVGMLQLSKDLVFGINGKPANPRTVSREFKDISKAAKLPPEVHFHSLRHTHATELLKAGVHPKKVQYRLGHSTFQITMDTYSHVTPDMQDEIADIWEKIKMPTTTAANQENNDQN